MIKIKFTPKQHIKQYVINKCNDILFNTSYYARYDHNDYKSTYIDLYYRSNDKRFSGVLCLYSVNPVNGSHIKMSSFPLNITMYKCNTPYLTKIWDLIHNTTELDLYLTNKLNGFVEEIY